MNTEKKIEESIITIRIQRFGKPVKPGSPFYENGYVVREIEIDNSTIYSDRTPMGMLENTIPDPIRKLEELVLGLKQQQDSCESIKFLKSLSLISIAISFSENTVRVSLKTDKIKSPFRELFIGLFSMFSSQTEEIILIRPNILFCF